MPVEQLAVLAVGLVLIAAVAGVVAWATAIATQRSPTSTDDPDPRPGLPPHPATGRDEPDARAWPLAGGRGSAPLLVPPGSARQVARVVAFLFLASVAVVVALTRAWPETEAAIVTLLAAGTLLVVFFMDMLPPTALGRARRPIEGIGAIVFLGLLMGLSGGIGSPFVVGFFLVVAGTALTSEGLAPLAIAVIAAVSVFFVGVIVSGAQAVEPAGLAWMGFTAVTLVLLADLAAAAARAQRQARDEAVRASRFDTLTGLYNRAFFFTTMEQEIRRSERMGRGFALLMLDLDDLKPVNDTFGHQWGDRLLRAVADVLRRTVRFTDAAARYGGDEFVVLLPETDAAGAFIVAETLRRDIAALSLRAADRNVRSSVSVGLVTYPDDGTTLEHLVAAADVAMYESKRRGKNQIVGYRTRTERVATAIDVSVASEMVALGQETAARTGGDVPPWASPGSGEGRAAHEDHAAREGQPARAPGPALEPPAPARASPRGLHDPDPSPPRGTEGRGHRPASGTGDVPAAGSDRGADAARGGPDAAVGGRSPDPPWLTRTDGQATGRARTDEPSPGPNQRPPADRRASGRDTSRREEIERSPERPWIALPIEPYEPPERPQRPERPDRPSRPSG